MISSDIFEHDLKIMIIFTLNNKKKKKIFPVVIENNNNLKCTIYLDDTVDHRYFNLVACS